MDKLITFAVPCYNSADYMDHCIETLLSAGEDAEIILVDDGSARDDTPAKCDEWAAKHPDIIRAIHQENGGHGEGVNQGIRHARGFYYKVVDSDDWLDTDALAQVVAKLREFAAMPAPVDLLIANYVYEHVEDNTRKVMGYKNVFPTGQIFTWDSIRHFRTYQPLPFVKTLYYMDLDLYRYFIGRADQSVNESVMAGRIDQQVRVTKQMIAAHDVMAIKATQPRLGRYMLNYLSMMMSISSIFSVIANTPQSLGLRTELWEYLRQKNAALYRRCRYKATNVGTNIPGYQGRKLSVGLYRLARKIYKFN